MNRLHGQQVKIGYGDNTIINKLDVEIPDGKVTQSLVLTAAGNLLC
ncbi:Ferrichrome transport ATP-binding protein fhuA [Staphylococcus aureus]|nr:Ferrichrome transport ATP-binding protein fhuA [Staphylococcus aureus]